MATLLVGSARADKMDPAFERLVLNPACTASVKGGGVYFNPAYGFTRCMPNDMAFDKIVAQLGTAIAPIPSYPARTTGFGGFKVSLQGSYTTIDHDAQYWQQGTQGNIDKSSNLSSVANGNPDSVLQQYSLRLSKGLPFGIEVGAAFGYLVDTTIVSGGGDVRISLLEGFRPYFGGLGYLPDIAVAGGVRTITGTSELKLTVASFDAGISKPIPIASTVILQPHVGYQYLRIFGDSGLISTTPNTDAVQHCGYQGDNNPATPDKNKYPAYDGQPVCSGSSAPFNNDVVFDPVRLTRHRINFGADLRFQMIYLGLDVLTDLVPVSNANPNNDGFTVPVATDPTGTKTIAPASRFDVDPNTFDKAVQTQWTVAVELGASF